jgi:SAM-dependent methyltransferase
VDHSKSDYKEYPKTLARDDYWGQVRRTVCGKPVSQDQIAMIVEAIRAGLLLCPSDVVLDLACGNGALSHQLQSQCAALHGVDFSEYLIEIANENFAVQEKVSFEVDDASSYIKNAPDTDKFTKALCYGSFSYFSADDAADVIAGISRRFSNIKRMMIGNLPDKDSSHLFYTDGADHTAQLRDHKTQIGIWRSENDMRELASSFGWELEISKMPRDFFAAHYRFDAILTR